MSKRNEIKTGRVTVHTVAKMAGVSAATVSRVLNDSPLVKPETRERVRQVLREAGFKQPNQLARALRTNRTGLIALLVENVLNPYYAVLAREIDDAAKKLGMTMVLANDDGDEGKSVERLKALGSLNVDGIVVAPWLGGDHRRETLLDLAASGMCIIGLGDLVDETEFDVVAVDYRRAAAEAVDHLVELGHERIGCIGPPVNSDRFTGYEDAMIRHGLSTYILHAVPFTDWGVVGDDLLDKLPNFLRDHELTAVLAHNDVYALEMLRTASMLNIRVPEDVSVVGFDGVPQGQNALPPLTTVRPPYAEMARKALDIAARTAGKNHKQPRVKKVYTAELIVRQSTAPAKRS